MHQAIPFLLACTTLWLCPPVAGQTTTAPLRKIAMVGDDAPGFPAGVTLAAIGGLPNYFGKQPQVAMDLDGEVAFFALLQGPGIIGGEVVGANSVTLWREVEDVLSLVVQQDDPIPGSPGQTFTGFPDMAPHPGFALADTPDILAGHVAFSATGGLYVYTDAGLAPVDLDSPPQGLPAGSFLSSLPILTPHAEPDGSVLFVAEYDVPYTTDTVTCVVRGRTDAPAEILLAEGLSVPDIGLPPDVVIARLPYITSTHGGVGFAFPEKTTDAFLLAVSLSGPGITNEDETLLAYEDGSFRLVAREGSPAPGTGTGGTWGFFTSGTVFGFGLPAMLNGRGQLAFAGDFTGGVAPGAAGVGMWTDRSGALENLVIADEVCTDNPGGPFGGPVPGMPNFTFSNILGGDFNGAGHIAFVANVIDSTIDPVIACFYETHQVLLTDLSGTFAVVLQRGVQVPGAEPGVVVSAFLGEPRLTHTDHVVVEIIVDGPGITGSNSVWTLAVGPDGGVRTLLRRGDLLDLGNGDVRAISSFELGRGVSNADEIPVALSFTDGTAGVFALRVTDHTLHVAPTEISTWTGGTADFELVAGSEHAGRTYVLAGSMSGTDPGVTFSSGTTLPLNVDSFSYFVLANANGPMLPGFFGMFDTLGDAAATLDTLGPVDPVLIGRVMHFAWISLGPIDQASSPVAVKFVL